MEQMGVVSWRLWRVLGSGLGVQGKGSEVIYIYTYLFIYAQCIYACACFDCLCGNLSELSRFGSPKSSGLNVGLD